jgi:cell fate regulator YaaT (PSP1 superfamily)
MIVKFFEWDQPKNVDSKIENLKNGDLITVNHEWGGTYLAEILIVDQDIEKEELVGEVLGLATEEELEKIEKNKTLESKILIEIKKKVRDLKLEMKIFEVKLSLDEKCLVVAFVAEGRVDFRNIVRELSSKYQKIVRFQQIGSRDEARQIGGYGICGREICCRKFPGCLKSITTEMARCQMVSHRGTERISGSCGRLMCCLGFEADQYQELLNDLPKRGDKIKYKGEEAEVIDLNPISQEIRIRKKDQSYLSIRKEDL